jgi:hypothetical protein
MNKLYKIIKVIIYYIITSYLFYKIFYFIWENFIFNCIVIEWEIDCLEKVVNSIMLWLGASLLFLIIDWILFKSYKKIFALFEKKEGKNL